MKSLLKYLFVLLYIAFFNVCAQTNVSGDITTNTTWTLAKSPYDLTGNIHIKNGAKLTIESGVNIFLQNKYIDVGDYYRSYSGVFEASGVNFNSGKIYFNNTSSGSITNCNFTNTPVELRYQSNPVISNNNFDGTSLLYFFSEEAFPRISGNSYGSQKINIGFNITKNLTIKKIPDVDYYVQENFSVQNGARLTIESGVNIFLQNKYIDVGDYYRSYSGVFEASGTTFNNGKIYFNNVSSGVLLNCDIQNTPITIRHNSSLVITKSNLDLFSNIENTSSKNVDAKNNYLGDPTGPKHSSNPAGYGTTISDKVDYVPFATSPFTFSSSLFVVGNRVFAKDELKVRNDQLSDVILFSQDAGVHGTIIEGPKSGTAGGYSGNWYKIDWESSPPNLNRINGWIAESFIQSIWPDGDVPKPDFTISYYTSSNHFWTRGFAPTSSPKATDFSPNAYGNCTWYAYGRMLELGYDPIKLRQIAEPGQSDASNWDNGAINNNILVDNIPSVGAIAQTDNGASGLGHVAIVESVNSDGTITITESSYSSSLSSVWNFLWRHRTLSPASFQNYIHVLKTSSTLFTISLYSSPSEGGSVTGAGTYNANSSVTISAKPATGWVFVNWTENNVVVSTNPDYTFIISVSRNLIANFEKVNSESIISNGNFDLGLTDWIYVEFTSGSSVSVKTESGNQFISLKHLTEYDWCSIGQEVRSKLTLGQRYSLNYRYKVASGNNFGLGARFADISTVMHSNFIDKDRGNSVLLSDGQWHTEVVNFTFVSDNPLSTEPVFAFIFDYTNVGEIYIDDISLSMITDIKNGENNIPTTIYLEQNYPNPFNPTTVINYSLPKTLMVRLEVFDITGRLVDVLIDQEQGAGFYRLTFSGFKIPSGVYYYRLRTPIFSETKKMLLLK